jgi:DNA polymerase-3 subunit beta
MADTLIGLLTARRRLELALGDGTFIARFGEVTLTSKLIQGSPPNFRQLIPEEPPLKVDVMALDLEMAVRRVQMVAREGSSIVRLIWTDDTLTVAARGEEMGEAEATVAVRASGGPGRTAMNISYLLEYLRGRQGLVTMGVKSEKEPVLFTHGPSPLVVIMPMFVQW